MRITRKDLELQTERINDHMQAMGHHPLVLRRAYDSYRLESYMTGHVVRSGLNAAAMLEFLIGVNKGLEFYRLKGQYEL